MSALWDKDLEAGLLCEVMRRPMFAKRVVAMRPTDFVVSQHQEIWRAIRETHEAGGRANAEAVQEHLRRAGRSGVASALKRFMGDAPACSGVSEAVTFLRDLGDRRSVRNPAMEIAAAAEAGDLAAARRLAKELAAGLDVEGDGTGWPWIYTSAEAAAAAIEAMSHREENPTVDLGDFAPLARHMLPGFLITVGGETGAGKSSFANWLADHWYRSTNTRTGIVSVEDRLEVWGGRAIAHASGETPYDGVNPNSSDGLTGNDAEALALACEDLRVRDPYRYAILDRNDIWEVERHMRRLVVAEGCGLLVVDYLTEITDASAPRGMNRREIMSNIARRIKTVGKQLGVPVILCAQLSRPDKKKHREPTIFELKETGDLENMSEAIALIWKADDTEDSQAFVKVAKLKMSPKRPRANMIRNIGGAIVQMKKFDKTKDKTKAEDFDDAAAKNDQ